jgi:peptidoglycan/xylan/chitin deacetylase (PgdA/CDA1 family)
MGRGKYSPTAGLHFDDEEFESRIAWIWTTARSGSTWLLRMLCHPLKLVDSRQDDDDVLGFVAPPTWQGKVDVFPVDTTFVSNHLLPLHGSADYSDDLFPVTFSSALGLRNRANYFFSAKYADAWRPEVRRMMLVRFHRFLERAAERYETDDPLLLLKEVAGAHAAPLVMSMFPRSKLVFLVRDGRDVVDSQTAANQPGGWLPVQGWKTPSEREEFVRRRARNWVGDVASIEKAFQAHPAELRTMVRYEDLLAAPAQNLRALIEFLGLRRGERWIERAVEVNSFESIAPEQKGPAKFFRSASPGAWRRNMTDTEAAILQEVMGEKIRELGYPLAESAADGAGWSDREPAGPSEPARNVVMTTVNKQAEGRDYTNLVRLIDRRGSPASRRERKVALTFDDGPVLRTYQVLEILERYGARGTFFLVGYKIDGHEELVRQLLSGEHEVGNHSYVHSPFPSFDDVNACATVLEHVTGERPELFRPPFGGIDTPGAEAAIADGMRVILWNVDSEDAVPPWQGISAEEITSNVLDNVSPGSIVLLHDGLPWSRSADALPSLIEGLQGEGYELVTVSELLEDPAPHRPTRTARLMRRLDGGGARASGNRPSANRSRRHPADVRRLLRGQLEMLVREVEPPERDEQAAELVGGAMNGLLRPWTASDLLLRHTAAQDNKGLLLVSLGLSLRRFERSRGDAAALPWHLAARLRAAGDPGAEAGVIGDELAAPRRYQRLIAARLSMKVAVAADSPAEPSLDAPDPPVDAPHSATRDFLSIFAPGSEVWQDLESWARATGRKLVRKRNRALLEAAGVDRGVDFERLIARLDVDFLFRFGYALAACEEVLSPTPS